jgi:hypothetical protein
MKDEEITSLDFSGLPIPDEFLTEIGRITILWARLESLLNICLGKLAGFDEPVDYRAFILITHTSFPQRLDSFSALCEQLHPQYPELADYKKVVSEIKAAQAIRNKFMHHTLSYNPESGLTQMAVGSARGTLKANVEVVSIEDIKRASIQIDEAHRALYKLVLRRDLPPLWSRSRTST